MAVAAVALAMGAFGIGMVAYDPGTSDEQATPPSSTSAPPVSVPADHDTLPETTLPAVDDVIWIGDIETGDVSQWNSISISGKADVEVVSTPTHSGEFAARLINWNVDGSHNAGVRLNMQGPFGPDPVNLPDDLYYSAWYFIPVAFEGDSNIFQFKQSDVTAWDDDGVPTEHTRRMLWKIGLHWNGDDTYDLEIRTRINPDSGEWQRESIQLGTVETRIPVGKWFQIETRYLWGQNGSGRTTVWLDGREVWNFAASTEASNLKCLHRCREWVVSHYLSDYQGYVAPGDSWMFVDDAMVSVSRVGTG